MLPRLSTSVWGHVFGFGDLATVGRVTQTCKRLRFLLASTKSLPSSSLASSSTLVLSTIQVGTIDDEYCPLTIDKLTDLGTRHLHCTGPFSVTGSERGTWLLGNLRSLHIGCIATNEVWLTIVAFGKRLEALVVEEALCPPLFSMEEDTFEDMKHLTRLILPQAPYRTCSHSTAMLEKRQQVIARGPGERFDTDLGIAGDAYTLWRTGQLLESTCTLDDDEATSWIEWFYRNSADRGYAMAQYDWSRFSRLLQEDQDCRAKSKGNSSHHIVDAVDCHVSDIHNMQGQGQGQDRRGQYPPKVTTMLYKAAMQSNVAALSELARLCQRAEDYETMAQYWRRAADQGDREAMCEMGHCHFYGLGVPMDDGECYKWFHRAAQVPLGGFLPYEPGPPWTYPLDDTVSMIHIYLGTCKMVGLGCPRDLESALESFDLALSHLASNDPAHLFARFLPRLQSLIAQWALQRVSDRAHDNGNIGRDIMDLEPYCAMGLYWKCRWIEGDNCDGDGSRLQSYWTMASVLDHVGNALLELSFEPPNEALVLKLLQHAIACSDTTITPLDKRKEATLQVRAFYLLGQAAERAKNPTLAKMWYERAASSPSHTYTEALVKLRQLAPS